MAEAEEVKDEEIDEDAEAAEVMATVLQEDDEDVFMKPASGFLLSQKWGFFTYKEWITKQQFLDRCQLNGLEVATDKDGQMLLYLGHETGVHDPQNPYKHTHGLVAFKDRPRIKDPRAFDIGMGEKERVHPHIQGVKNTVLNWNRVKAYVSKQDPDLVQVHEEATKWLRDNCSRVVKRRKQSMFALTPDMVDRLQAAGSATEAIKMGGDYRLVASISKLYELKEAVMRVDDADYPGYIGWASELRNQIGNLKSLPIIGREVTFIVGNPGLGKSTCVNHLRQEFPGCILYVNCPEIISNLAMQIVTDMESIHAKPEYIDAIFLDIPKTLFGHRALYQMLECLVNRFVRGCKYRGHQAFLKNLKLLYVFTNAFPNITAMGLDRYVVYEIYDQRTQRLAETESKLPENPLDKAGKQRAYLEAMENSYLHLTTVSQLRFIRDKQLQQQQQQKKRTARQAGWSDDDE